MKDATFFIPVVMIPVIFGWAARMVSLTMLGLSPSSSVFVFLVVFSLLAFFVRFDTSDHLGVGEVLAHLVELILMIANPR